MFAQHLCPCVSRFLNLHENVCSDLDPQVSIEVVLNRNIGCGLNF